jgi:hypothetical protein
MVKGEVMGAYIRLPAAGSLFFFSSWLTMLFAGGLSPYTGVRPFGYITAMVVTIAIWLAVAPAIGAVSRGRRRH